MLVAIGTVEVVLTVVDDEEPAGVIGAGVGCAGCAGGVEPPLLPAGAAQEQLIYKLPQNFQKHLMVL